MAAAAAIAVLAFVVGALLWKRSIENARDQWWRAEIAASSEAVRAKLAAGSAEAVMTDADIISTLGDTDAKLADAEKKLADSLLAPGDSPAGSRPPSATGICPRIPAACVGLR
jgi:hypothetical protein